LPRLSRGDTCGGASSNIPHPPRGRRFRIRIFLRSRCRLATWPQSLHVFAMNESPPLPLGHVVQSDAEVFKPTFAEVIEVAVRPSGVNHCEHRVGKELNIDSDSCPGEAMAGIIHPQERARRAASAVSPAPGTRSDALLIHLGVRDRRCFLRRLFRECAAGRYAIVADITSLLRKRSQEPRRPVNEHDSSESTTNARKSPFWKIVAPCPSTADPCSPEGHDSCPRR
jgi:hypothetical protein